MHGRELGWLYQEDASFSVLGSMLTTPIFCMCMTGKGSKVYMCVYVCMYVCMCMYTHIYIYAYVSVYMHGTFIRL